jgi:glycerophosphoryl diester phosphodiesterase
MSLMKNTRLIEIHGHRGARGYYPENTITSFIEAIKFGVDAIELDVVISKDLQVVVSHEAWMNDVFCTGPDGTEVEKNSQEKYNLYKMNYAEIAKYDCGKRGNPEFPLQEAEAERKPLLNEVITKTDSYSKENKLLPVKYNIEIKTEEGERDGVFNPGPKKFVELVLKEIKKYNIADRTNLQSFDIRVMNEIKKQEPKIRTALLVENTNGLEANMKKLDFIPDTYSPEFILVDEDLVQKVHEKNMKLIPWTVNEVKDMRKLIAMGVDGIITDYPDRAIDLIRK